MCLFPRPSSTIVPIFQITATEAPATQPLSTHQLLAHLCSSSFCKQSSASHHPVHRQHLQKRWGCAHQKRSQTAAKWVACLVHGMHLEYRYPGLLDECVHLLRKGCVCTIFTLHHHDSFTVRPFATITSSTVVRAKPVFHVVIPFSLPSSCACLASFLKLNARLLTCSRVGK